MYHKICGPGAAQRNRLGTVCKKNNNFPSLSKFFDFFLNQCRLELCSAKSLQMDTDSGAMRKINNFSPVTI